MMARFWVEIEVPGEVEESFAGGKRAVVVPLSDNETLQFGMDVIVVHDGISVMADSLTAFIEGRERFGEPDPELKSAIGDIAACLRNMAERQGQVREVLGRAIFVNVVQRPEKGRMQ